MKKLLFIIAVVLIPFCSTPREELASQKVKALKNHYLCEEWDLAEQTAFILLSEYAEYIDTISVRKLYDHVRAEKHLTQAKEFFTVKQYREAEDAYAKALSIYPLYKPALKWYNDVELYKFSHFVDDL